MKRLIAAIGITTFIAVLSVIGYNMVQSTNATPTLPVASSPAATPPTVDKLLELTNAERAKAGVAPLVLDERLNQSAQMTLKDLETEGWFKEGHINSSGVNTGSYIYETYRSCPQGSENLAKDYATNPIKGFASSKAHWDAILNPVYDQVGFAIDGNYLVQHFCDLR